MNTSILTTALASILLAGHSAAPTWQTSYNQAQEQGVAQKKPLAVVFGTGSEGWSKVVRDGAPTAEATQLMADKYVCVYVDTASLAGQKLAQSFGITGNVGMVLSDRTGALQAFWHQGDLTNQSMVSVLQKFADPNLTISTTETGTRTRTSFYPSSGSDGGIGSLTPGYCPSCNNARGRR